MITVFSEDPELFKKKILHFFYKGEGIGNVFFVLAKVVIFPNFVPETSVYRECIFVLSPLASFCTPFSLRLNKEYLNS